MSNDADEDVRFNVQMSRRLRNDAKRNTERGELSESVRKLFRRKAYGTAGTEQSTEIERKKAELRDVRDTIDQLRRKRRRIDAEIETKEQRAARLEERIAQLEERDDKFDTVVDTLEGSLLEGQRVTPTMVDDDLDAQAVIETLKDRNPDVPNHAFELATPGEPTDWRRVS